MANELQVVLDAQSNLSEVFTKTGIDAKALQTQLHGLAEDALQGMIDFANEGVTATLDLAESQRNLATITGSSAHEAGVLIQALDDAGISSDALTTAAKKLNAEGLSLNVDTLRDLRSQYQQLDDPVERAKFASENFGKAAGPEMQKALNLSNAAFEEFISGAEESALALGDDAVQAARDYEVAQDNMADAVQSAQVIIGQELIPILTDLTNLTTENLVPAIGAAVDIWDAAKTSVDQLSVILAYYSTQQEVASGKITEGEAATRLQALAWQESTLTAEQLAQAQIDAGAALDASDRAANALKTTTEDLTTAQEENIGVTDEQKQVYGLAEAAIRDLNVSEAERHSLEVALKIASGEMTVEDLKRENAVKNLTQALEAGSITQAEYMTGLQELATEGEVVTVTLGGVGSSIKATGSQAATAADEVGGYNDELGQVPQNVSTTITTTYAYNGTPPPQLNSEGQTALGGGMALGGVAMGPSSGYPMVLHGTEAVVPLPDGRTIPVQLQGAGGGTVVNVYLNYAPMLSLGDRVELETRIKPMFERLGFVSK